MRAAVADRRFVMSDTQTSTSALVLFSGGQDSATCLAWALERFDRVETVGFDYGQRHVVEMQARQAVREGMRAALPALAAHARSWCEAQAGLPDLASRLTKFCSHIRGGPG